MIYIIVLVADFGNALLAEVWYNKSVARVVELVDTHALGACAARRTGSSPASGTRFVLELLRG